MSAHILWAVVIGFFVGVFLRSVFLISWPVALFFFLVGTVSVLYSQYDISYWRRYCVVAAALFSIAFGLLRMEVARIPSDVILDTQIGERVVIEGTVVAEPDSRDSNIRLHVRVDTLIPVRTDESVYPGGYPSATTPVQAGVLVIAPLHSDVSYGDRVRAEGELELPVSFDTSLGRQFNYPMFLAKDGILYTLAFAQVEKISDGRGNFLKAAAIWTKQKYLSGLHMVLPEPESGLAGGITVGDKRGGGKDLTDIFITVGLVHIVVLSGYNITLIMDFVGRLLARAARSFQLVASLTIVIFIVLMAGASATAIRAGAMALIPLVARMTGRLYIATRTLGVVAFGMVIWNPYLLVFDPGFQLSILATLGLILFSPYLEFSRVTAAWGIRGIVSATLATQIMVLPLLLHQNGLLSVVALPVNILALIVVPFAMVFSAVSAVAGILFGSFGTFIAFPAYVLLAYIIKVAEFFASLPIASVSIPVFSAWLMCAAYVLLGVGYLYIKKKEQSDNDPLLRRDIHP